MVNTDSLAYLLATHAAISAGEASPWRWAAEHVNEFRSRAADPAVQAELLGELERGLDDQVLDELGRLFIGPPPALDAGAEAHAAYAEALLDLLAPVDARRRSASPTAGSDA